VLLIGVESDADGFKILDGARKIDERATKTIYGPGNDRVEPPATGILEHRVEARPLVQPGQKCDQ